MHRVTVAAALVLVFVSPGCLHGFVGQDEVGPADYIRDDVPHWIIEVDYVQGHRPDPALMDFLKDRLNEVVHKESITVRVDDVVPGRSVWSVSDLRAVQEQYQDHENTDDTVVTYVLFINGRYEQDRVLGITSEYDLIGYFDERIEKACDDNLLCIPFSDDQRRVERAVLVHEFGHALGLVDRGVPMVQEHSDGGAHSSNENSVMFAQAETTGIFGLANIPTSFDADDKRDLGCFGGKPAC